MWFWLKIWQSSMVHEGCWVNFPTRVGNLEASTLDSVSLFDFLHYFGLEGFKRFISISHTVTCQFFDTWWNDLPSREQEICSVQLGVCPMQLFHFWSRDVHPVQNLLLCTKFHEKYGWFFTEIWRYIDFQNGGRLPSWNCFTTIRDHPRSLCCWLQLPVKLHVNLIHRSEDIAVWIFHIFGLKCLFRPPKWGLWGLWTPKCDYSSLRPPKGTSLRKSTSFKLSTVKIRWGVWTVGELTESVMDTHR